MDIRVFDDLEQLQPFAEKLLYHLVPRTRRPRRIWKNKSKARKQWAQKGPQPNEQA